MILISSGAYVGNDLINEFGKLPPSFLPLQNLRLFCHQIELFKNWDDLIVLSIPEDYQLDKKDSDFLNEKKVEIVRVPQNISLGSSIVYVLNYLGRYEEPLRLLYGDTLFMDIKNENDVFYVSDVHDNYNWDYLEEENSNLIFSGYFSFSNQKKLINAITVKNYKFIEAVRFYRETNNFFHKIVDDWLDFGLTSTYFRSKSLLTTQRIFNDLKINKFSVLKSSHNKLKMNAESSWFQNLPHKIKYFVPQFYNSFEDGDKIYYEIEYLNLNSLSDLFVFGKHPIYVWKEIFSSCQDFLNNCFLEKKISRNSDSNYTILNKTISRLNEYSKKSGFDLNQKLKYNGLDLPSIAEIIDNIDADFSFQNENYETVVHGDFCFSNILYDFRKRAIKVIDPRGLDLEENITIYGDIRYDLAKLSHSVIGLYDYIISGYYYLEVDDDYDFNFSIVVSEDVKLIQSEFLKLNFFDKTIVDHNIYSSLVHLFLSMLPLHSDNPKRQKAFIANALRIYVEYIKI